MALNNDDDKEKELIILNSLTLTLPLWVQFSKENPTYESCIKYCLYFN